MTSHHLIRKTGVAIGATILLSTATALASAPLSQGLPALSRPLSLQTVADTGGGTAAGDATGAGAAQSRNAARSRLRECGHQWSAMKRNGSASGMTWKEFSQGCLVRQ